MESLDSESGDPVAIRTVALGRHYRSGPGQLNIFSSLDLEIRAGERVSLTGESGAGKSTLLYLLGGAPTQDMYDLKPNATENSCPVQSGFLDLKALAAYSSCSVRWLRDPPSSAFPNPPRACASSALAVR